MSISLYEATVATHIQILGAMGGFLAKGLSHCKDNKIDPATIVDTCLFADMQPFRFQVQQAAVHSLGAIEGLKSGQFSPQRKDPAQDYAGLQALTAETLAALKKIAPEEVNSRETADVLFSAGEYQLPFTGAGFLLSFSLPNFYFHVTTAYDILRMAGVPIGKGDFIGALRLKS